MTEGDGSEDWYPTICRQMEEPLPGTQQLITGPHWKDQCGGPAVCLTLSKGSCLSPSHPKHLLGRPR